MLWKGLNVIEILQIGVIGLGFLLALLAYHLLTKEQKQVNPRPIIIRSIYAFMSFSVVLCLVGILSQVQGLFVDEEMAPTSSHQDQEKSNEMKRYKDLLSNLKRTQAVNESLDSDLRKVKAENAQLQSKFRELIEVKTKNEELSSTLEKSKKEIRAISAKLKSVSSKKSKVDSELSTLRQQLSICVNSKESMTRDFATELNKLKEESSIATQSKDSTSIFPLEPFWLVDDVVVRLANGRVLVVYDFSYSPEKLIVTSERQREVYRVSNTGERFEFSYDNAKYFIDVLNEVRQEKKILVSIIPAQ